MKAIFPFIGLAMLFSINGFTKSTYPLVTCRNDDGTWGNIEVSDGRLVMRLDGKVSFILRSQEVFKISGKSTGFDDFISEMQSGEERYKNQEFEIKRESNGILIEKFEVYLNGAAGSNWYSRGKKLSEYRLHNCEAKTLW